MAVRRSCDGRVLRDPEVDQVGVLAVAVGPDQGVAGLDVAVDQAARVRRVQRARELPDQRHRPLRRQRPLPTQQLRQVDAVDEPHRDVQQPVRLARLVDRDDRGVLDRRRQPRLAQEPLAIGAVVGERRPQQLQRDLAPEPQVLGAVDDAHSAAAEQRVDDDMSPIVEPTPRKGSVDMGDTTRAPPTDPRPSRRP